MNVLHVITGIDRGGAEGHVVGLARHQRTAGMGVTVAYLRGQGYWASTLRDAGVGVHHLGLRVYGDVRPAIALRRLISGSRFDLVHAHLPPAELYVRLALLGCRTVPVVITKHNDERFAPTPGQRALGRWVGSRAHRVVAISDAVKRFMTSDELGLDSSKLSTIHYGIDASPFASVSKDQCLALRRSWGIGDDVLTVGFVGRLVPQKDIDTLLEGFALFATQKDDVRLVIVGMGPLRDHLHRRVQELGVSDRVVFAGFREDIETVMAAFDVFALTSCYEGLGLVLLEAMAAGRPVVATRVSAIPEVVQDGMTGILIEAGNPRALATALSRLEDATLRTHFGAKGRRRILDRFTLDRMFRSMDELYDACVRNDGSPAGVRRPSSSLSTFTE